MRTFTKSQIRYTKSQRMGIFVVLIAVAFSQFLLFLQNRPTKYDELQEIPEEVLAIQGKINEKTFTSFESKDEIKLTQFNPNELSSEDWQKLGFSEKQSQTILKYKYSLGGNFNNLEQIKNCYVISERKFFELEPYIQLKPIEFISQPNFQKEGNIKIYAKFNPNDYQLEDWMKIGFSERQSKAILHYKSRIGGNFSSLEQIKKCYVISDHKFSQIKPYIIFPSKKKQTEGTIKLVEEEEFQTETLSYKFNPDKISEKEWLDLGFSSKQIATILKYKESIGGKFHTKESLKKCYVISDEKFAEIEPYIDFQK